MHVDMTEIPKPLLVDQTFETMNLPPHHHPAIVFTVVDHPYSLCVLVQFEQLLPQKYYFVIQTPERMLPRQLKSFLSPRPTNIHLTNHDNVY